MHTLQLDSSQHTFYVTLARVYTIVRSPSPSPSPSPPPGHLEAESCAMTNQPKAIFPCDAATHS